MAEQYIYSRSEREFTNALHQTIPLGFGFMALSPGMNRELKRDVAVHCEDCPRPLQTDKEGLPLPLFRKARLPKGQVLLQGSAWIEQGSRNFHVAHGYVMDEQEIGSSGWLAAEFRLEDPNAIPGGIPPLESLRELPVQEHIEFCRLQDAALGLSGEGYCQLLLACFDALASRRQVLIAWDFERFGERELWRSVLYWLYTCLPYDLRACLGFDSIYTDKSAPGLIHLAFVDRTLIRDDGRTPGIQQGSQVIPLGGNFLVLDGKIIHNDDKYKTKWYKQGGGYGSWLKQLVRIVWNSPEEKREAVTQALADIQQSLQRQTGFMLEEKRLSPESYDRACERGGDLQKLKEAAGLVKSEPPAVKAELPVVKSNSPAVKAEPPVVKPKPPVVKPEPTEQTFWNKRGGEAAWQQRFKWYDEIAAAYDMTTDFAGYLSSSLDKLPGISSAQRASMAKECLQRLDDCFQRYFGSILLRRAIPANPNDICYLSSISGGWMGAAARGVLGAFLARDADTPELPLCSVPPGGRLPVLSYYQWYLADGYSRPSGTYSQLLSCLFWGRMTDVERNVWNRCGVSSSTEAAIQRRFKMYREIVTVYSAPACDTAAWARYTLDALQGLGSRDRAEMKKEMEMVLKTIAGLT